MAKEMKGLARAMRESGMGGQMGGFEHPSHHSDPIVGGESEREGKAMGKGSFANMPQEVHFKAYPKASEYGPSVLDDTMGHVDKVNKASEMKSHRHVSNQH